MCGLAGIVALHPGAEAPARDALTRMAGVLSHRGPDEYGLYRDDHAGLAHARLSIVDLQTGQQPMADSSKTLWIVFNGEIFNFVELRAELITLGHQFRTHSDTEVILHAWRAWGEAAFERMNGQWAVALWDSAARRLVLARDPMGICPLHLCEHGPYLYFGSEVKAIFAANSSIPRALDPVGMDQTLTFWSIVPPQSVFQGVTELEPGHVRVYENGTVHDRAFAPAVSKFQGSLEDAVVAVREALDHATELRILRADVPVGSYLSGGLDSSLVTALGQRYAGNRFQTFSLRFEDAEYDETAYQRLMVQQIGSEHHEVMVSRQDIASIFPEVIYHTERPILRTAPAPLFLLSRLVRQHGIKVVLTGEGADEAFAGYDLFREGKVRRFWGRQPASSWRPRLLERLYPYLARSPVAQQAMARQFFGRNISQHESAGFAHDTRWHTTSALKRLLNTDMQAGAANRHAVAELLDSLPPNFVKWDPLAQDQYIEIRTLLAGYLLSSQGDRMLLGNSVEGRFPFLDKDVMALAHSLPAAHKLRVLDEKHVVKRAAQGLVPSDIIARQKQPYRAPDALSFVAPDAPDYIAHAFSDQALRESNVFDPKAVAQLFNKCRGRSSTGQFSNADNMALVAVLSTQLLHQQFVSNCPAGNVAVQFKTDIDHSSQMSP
jgi:asparagine synthase (glutamine-hydrolysing)